MSTTRALVRRMLVDLRWHIFWYGAGLGLYSVGIIAAFPAFEETFQELQYPEEFLRFFGVGSDLSNPAVFMTAEYFSFAPVVLLVFVIVASTGALGGEEGRGSLEILLAQPVARSRLYLAKALALLLATLAIIALAVLGWLIILPAVDLHGIITARHAVTSHMTMLPLLVAFGGWGMFLAAIAPSRGQAAGILSALLILAYLASSLAQAIEPIAWLRHVSPYSYADVPQLLTDGPVAWHQALLLAAGAAGGTLGLFAFAGREVAGGVWQPGALLRGVRPGGAH